MITEVGDYFARGCGRCNRFASPDCATRIWSTGLAALRRICLSAGLVEVVKWGHPCYMHAGRNIAIIGALRGDYRLSFMNAALLKDPEQILEKSGPNTAHADMIRFRDPVPGVGLEQVLLRYLEEAKGYAEAGLKAPRGRGEVVLPDELIEALDADPELAEAFHRLTPGRQRSYVIHLSSAKASATRQARIIRCRDRILAGKGAMER